MKALMLVVVLMLAIALVRAHRSAVEAAEHLKVGKREDKDEFDKEDKGKDKDKECGDKHWRNRRYNDHDEDEDEDEVEDRRWRRKHMNRRRDSDYDAHPQHYQRRKEPQCIRHVCVVCIGVDGKMEYGEAASKAVATYGYGQQAGPRCLQWVCVPPPRNMPYQPYGARGVINPYQAYGGGRV